MREPRRRATKRIAKPRGIWPMARSAMPDAKRTGTREAGQDKHERSERIWPMARAPCRTRSGRGPAKRVRTNTSEARESCRSGRGSEDPPGVRVHVGARAAHEPGEGDVEPLGELDRERAR